MCRGGKDGQKRRCSHNDSQKQYIAFRKKIKYRADKENITVEAWKEAHPEQLQALSESLPANPSYNLTLVAFQPVTEQRRLPDGIPMKLADHVAMSKDHIDSMLSEHQKGALFAYTGFGAGIGNEALLHGADNESLYSEGKPSWSEGGSGFADKADLSGYIDTMDTVVGKRQEEQRILYRGTPIYSSIHHEMEEMMGKKIEAHDTSAVLAGLQEYYAVGKVIDYPSYLSTTHSAYYAAERTSETSGTEIDYYNKPEVLGLVFEMKTNAGIDVTGIARHYSHEREVVLPRDMKFKVVGLELKPASYETVSGYDYLGDDTELHEGNYQKLAAVVQMVEVDDDGNEIMHTNDHSPKKLDWSE